MASYLNNFNISSRRLQAFLAAVLLVTLGVFFIIARFSSSTADTRASHSDEPDPKPTPVVAESTTPPEISSIPADVSYSVLASSTLPDDSVTLNVRINKPVSENVLSSIATTLRAQQPSSSPHLFVFYYLPKMDVGHGAWATSNFEPALDVKILGYSAEAAAKAEHTQLPIGTLVGRWQDNSPPVGNTITIFIVNGKPKLLQVFDGGGDRTIDLVEHKTSDGRRFEDVEGSDAGDYYLINKGGDLEIRNNNGLILTAAAVAK